MMPASGQPTWGCEAMATLGVLLVDPPAGSVATTARCAEEVGLEYLLVTEQSRVPSGPLSGRDPVVASTIALSATDHLKVGTGVAGSIYRPAVRMAQMAATLTEFSPRFVLGCGISHPGFAEYAGAEFPRSPIEHARAYLRDLRRFREEDLGFGGDFPVWWAALGPKMIEVGLDEADGVILNFVSPSTVSDIVRRAGTTDVIVYVRVGVSEELIAGADAYRKAFPVYARHFAQQGATRANGYDDLTMALRPDGGFPWSRLEEYADAGAAAVIAIPSGLSPSRLFEIV